MYLGGTSSGYIAARRDDFLFGAPTANYVPVTFINGNNVSTTKNLSIDGHTQAFSTITATPTTAAGYGITDVYTKREVDTNISTETTARETADTTLTTNLNSEITRAKAAEKTNSDNLTTEITNRTNADTSLQTNIDNEVTRATTAETTNANSISTHIADKTNPHAVTKTQVGLSNVDNTSDLDKPISTATQTAFGLKLDKKPDGSTDLIDGNNKINTFYIPDSVLGQLKYKGTFGVDGLPADPTLGDYYICNAAVTVGTVEYDIGDWAVYNGTK